jgi:hypothetical protein
MTENRDRVLPKKVETYKQKVEQWRRSREKRGRMPEALWQEAVELAKTHGRSFVASSANLSYSNLCKRMHDCRGLVKKEPVLTPTFVEVDTAMFDGASTHRGADIEMTRADGHRLVVRNADAHSVVQVASLFLEGCR